MKSDKAVHGSGKTHFSRIKKPGESWVELRDAAVKAGTWKKPVDPSPQKI